MVALSTEVDLIAAVGAVKKTIYLKRLLCNLDFAHDSVCDGKLLQSGCNSFG